MSVLYVSGLVWWVNATFRLAQPPERCMELNIVVMRTSTRVSGVRM